MRMSTRTSFLSGRCVDGSGPAYCGARFGGELWISKRPAQSRARTRPGYCSGRTACGLVALLTTNWKFRLAADGISLLMVSLTAAMPTIPGAAPAQSGCHCCPASDVIEIGSTRLNNGVDPAGKASTDVLSYGPRPVA